MSPGRRHLAHLAEAHHRHAVGIRRRVPAVVMHRGDFTDAVDEAHARGAATRGEKGRAGIGPVVGVDRGQRPRHDFLQGGFHDDVVVVAVGAGPIGLVLEASLRVGLFENRLRFGHLERRRPRTVERQMWFRNLEPPGERDDRRARIQHDVADILGGDAFRGCQKRGGEEPASDHLASCEHGVAPRSAPA
jgi:hypothetical protein